jgi:hypothetical protein
MISLNFHVKEEEEERNGTKIYKRSRTANKLADVKEEKDDDDKERIGASIYKRSRMAKMNL